MKPEVFTGLQGWAAIEARKAEQEALVWGNVNFASLLVGIVCAGALLGMYL